METVRQARFSVKQQQHWISINIPNYHSRKTETWKSIFIIFFYVPVFVLITAARDSCKLQNWKMNWVSLGECHSQIQFQLKTKNCTSRLYLNTVHHNLIKSYQTHMNFFLLRNIIKYIYLFLTNGSPWSSKWFGYQHPLECLLCITEERVWKKDRKTGLELELWNRISFYDASRC